MADISRRTLVSRALLVSALGGGAVLGLTRPIKHKVALPPPPPPAALTAALARQRQLLARYDRALVSQPAHPGLAGLRADVAAHGNALRALLQRYPGWRLSSSSTVPASPRPGATTAPVVDIADLVAASSAAAAAAARDCLQWPASEPHAGEVVPVLGSIAACLTSHARVLR